MGRPIPERASLDINTASRLLVSLIALASTLTAHTTYASALPGWVEVQDVNGHIYAIPTSQYDPADVSYRQITPPPVGPAQPPEPPAPSPPAECAVPARAISETDSIQPFSPPHGRFSKVPRYLVPFFEQACADYRIPVRYLLATASYESHFNQREFGDSHTSCGMFQFRDTRRRWTNWGFTGLEDCQNPERNIRKAAEAWRKSLDGGRDIATTIRKHNGAGPRAERYKAMVLFGAKTYYAG